MANCQRFRGVLIVWTVAAAAVMWLAADADAQQPPMKRMPKPEDIGVTTKDGVLAKATFYPGTEGKESVPVILLHMHRGDRHELARLAKMLQRQGRAVLVPDLRGHGDSVNLAGSNRRLDADRMPNQQFAQMVTQDLEAWKTFLMERNNAGELNIDKLCVVGFEMGAVIGAYWTQLDWSWPPLAIGKQGQDVKTLALVSPPTIFKGMRVSKALEHPALRNDMPIYIAVGAADKKAYDEAKGIFGRLDGVRPMPTRPEEQMLFFDETMDTRLQGSKLLSDERLGLDGQIGRFIELRAANLNLPWRERPNPLQ